MTKTSKNTNARLGSNNKIMSNERAVAAALVDWVSESPTTFI